MHRHTIEEIKYKFKERGYILLSTDYKNNKQKLDVICPKGHQTQIRYDMFSNGRQCPICFGTPKYTYEYVKEQIEKEGYKLLSDSYLNTHEKLSIKCNKGHEYKTSFYIWNHMKHRCPECAIKRNVTKRR